MKIRSLLIFLGVLLLNITTHAQSADAVIKDKIENGKVSADGIEMDSQIAIPRFYSNRAYELAWESKKNREDLISEILDSYNEGLDPNDYHLERISRLIKKSDYKSLSVRDKVDLDLLLTDAMVNYGTHLISGKVDQSKLRTGWDVPKNHPPENVDSLINATLKSHSIGKAIDELKPQTYLYENLKIGLKRYREIAEKGGWPKIEEGETLKLGMEDERLVNIRAYLQINNDLPDYNVENPIMFDEELEKGVKRFQYRHNLTEDGVIGKGTLRQMNISAEDRVETIRLNLERSRWAIHIPGDDFLVVNIAGFYIKRITNNKEVYSSRVIVGKNHHESPIFHGKMKYVEMNPTWTLPYSIATRETLPKLKNDLGYLAAKHMIIMDRNGKVLDPNTIDFNAYSSGNFPYTIRQTGGPWNALGEIKFMFPNKYAVYLHDTPSRQLFDRQDRAFSHGCIRLDKKWELLMGLMDEPDVWNMDKINSIINSGKTTRVNLKNPIDIYILYWTAGVDRESNIYFERDVYNRDESVLKLLNKPMTFKTVLK